MHSLFLLGAFALGWAAAVGGGAPSLPSTRLSYRLPAIARPQVAEARAGIGGGRTARPRGVARGVAQGPAAGLRACGPAVQPEPGYPWYRFGRRSAPVAQGIEQRFPKPR